jgi:hypothetical protein
VARRAPLLAWFGWLAAPAAWAGWAVGWLWFLAPVPLLVAVGYAFEERRLARPGRAVSEQLPARVAASLLTERAARAAATSAAREDLRRAQEMAGAGRQSQEVAGAGRQSRGELEVALQRRRVLLNEERRARRHAEARLEEARRGRSDPLPRGWQEVDDPSSGRSYYHHASTDETTWERPSAAPSNGVRHATPPSTPGSRSEEAAASRLWRAASRPEGAGSSSARAEAAEDDGLPAQTPRPSAPPTPGDGPTAHAHPPPTHHAHGWHPPTRQPPGPSGIGRRSAPPLGLPPISTADVLATALSASSSAAPTASSSSSSDRPPPPASAGRQQTLVQQTLVMPPPAAEDAEPAQRRDGAVATPRGWWARPSGRGGRGGRGGAAQGAVQQGAGRRGGGRGGRGLL